MASRCYIRKELKAKGGRAISFRALFSLLVILVVVLQSVLYVSVFFASGSITNSRESAYARFGLQVDAAAGTLGTDMIHRWDGVYHLARGLEAKVNELLSQEGATTASITFNSDTSFKVLNEAFPTILEAASLENEGTFLVLVDGTEATDGSPNPDELRRNGIYVRDSDLTRVSSDDSDLLFAAAPLSITRKNAIALGSGWTTHFVLPTDEEDRSFYTETIRVANQNKRLSTSELTHWSVCQSYSGSARPSLIFSVPLRDANGVVWGVLGTEITMTTVATELPFVSIDPNNSQAVSLALATTSDDDTDGSATYSLLGVNGASYASYVNGSTLETYVEGDMRYADSNNPKVSHRALVTESALRVYEERSPYVNERWSVVGFEAENLLFADINYMTRNLLGATVVAFVVGIVAVVVVGRVFSSRVHGIVRATRSSSLNTPLLIDRTGISEFDALSSSLEQYSRATVKSLGRLMRIMKMSGRLAAAFERVSQDPDTYLFTDSYATLLDLENLPGIPEASARRVVAGEPLGSEDVLAIDAGLRSYVKDTRVEGGQVEVMLFIPTTNRWVSMIVLLDEDGIPEGGYLTDATEEMEVRQRLENERDYDILTGLFNRGAFEARASELLEKRAANVDDASPYAMVMLDLDNLKYVNDTYGHDMGDLYIKTAAKHLKILSGAGNVVARISGDEFMVLVSSCSTKDEVLELLSNMQSQMRGDSIMAGENDVRHLLCSIGVAFAPEAGTDFASLKAHADEAMYMVKHGGKNDLHVFGRD